MCGNSVRGNRETRTTPASAATDERAALVKERTRQINAQAVRESDSAIVPEKSPNNGSPVPAEAMEGRALAERNAAEDAATQAQTGPWHCSTATACVSRPEGQRGTQLPGTPASRLADARGCSLDAITQGKSRMR